MGVASLFSHSPRKIIFGAKPPILVTTLLYFSFVYKKNVFRKIIKEKVNVLHIEQTIVILCH